MGKKGESSAKKKKSTPRDGGVSEMTEMPSRTGLSRRGGKPLIIASPSGDPKHGHGCMLAATCYSSLAMAGPLGHTNG